MRRTVIMLALLAGCGGSSCPKATWQFSWRVPVDACPQMRPPLFGDRTFVGIGPGAECGGGLVSLGYGDDKYGGEAFRYYQWAMLEGGGRASMAWAIEGEEPCVVVDAAKVEPRNPVDVDCGYCDMPFGDAFD